MPEPKTHRESSQQPLAERPDLTRRPDIRERAFLFGVASLPDDELLALLLGTGHPGVPVDVLASDLLDEEGGLRGLARSSEHLLAALPGVGRTKALRVAASVELGRRVSAPAPSRAALTQAQAVFELMAPRISHLEHEELWLLALDGRSALKAARRVAKGGQHGLSVSPREVLRAAVICAASAMVLVHNHPSGDPNPSAQDVAMSHRVALAGDIVGVPLVDHVIIAGDGGDPECNVYASLLELDLLSLSGDALGAAALEDASASTSRRARFAAR